MSPPDKDGTIPQLFSIFHGEVASLQAYGAFIRIPNCKKQGLVHKSQMSSARIEDPSEMLAKGEKVYCKVIAMEGEGEKISLSMKVVSQTTGQDLDPNNIQLDQDAKKRRQWKHIGKDKIELGAELNTTCKRCGGHGHLTMDCFAGKDGTQYELIPDIETLTQLPSAEDLLKSHHSSKKKKKKDKKKKSKRKRSTSSGSDSSSTGDDDKRKSSHSKHSSKKKPKPVEDNRKSRKEHSDETKSYRHSSSSPSESPSPYHSHDRERGVRTRPGRDKQSSKWARQSRSQDKKESRDKRKREDSAPRNSSDDSSSGNVRNSPQKRTHSQFKASIVRDSQHSDYSSAESSSRENDNTRQQGDVRERRRERRSTSRDRHRQDNRDKDNFNKGTRKEMRDYSQYSKDRSRNESYNRDERDRHRERRDEETRGRRSPERDKRYNEHRDRRKEQYSD